MPAPPSPASSSSTTDPEWLVFDLTTIKVHLGITGTGEDTFLNQIGPQCEAALLASLGITVEQTTFTEFYSGTGKPRLYLRNTPVQSITTIHSRSDLYFGDGEAETAADLLTAGVDYTLARDQQSSGSNIKSKSGIVHRIGGLWERPRASHESLLASSPGDGLGNIKVVYVAGWPSGSIPADIKLALNQMIAQVRASAKKGQPYQSESVDYYSYSAFAPADIAKAVGSVQYLVKNHKKIVLC